METILNINWNPDPEIFRLGGFALRYYSLMFMLAFICGYRVLYNIFKQEKVSTELLNPLFLYIFFGTLIGARLGHTLLYEFDYYKHHLLEIILPYRFTNGTFELTGYQGLASHGGAIGILMAVILYCKKYKLSFLWLVDRLVVAIALAAFFIRVGNLFNSEIIGSPSNVSWAFIFEKVDFIPRHPAQVYEAVLYLALFFILWMLRKRNLSIIQNGFLFGYFLMLLFGIRFFVEFLKADQEAFESGWLLNMGQLLSLPFIIAGICLLVVKSKSVHIKNKVSIGSLNNFKKNNYGLLQ